MIEFSATRSCQTDGVSSALPPTYLSPTRQALALISAVVRKLKGNDFLHDQIASPGASLGIPAQVDKLIEQVGPHFFTSLTSLRKLKLSTSKPDTDGAHTPRARFAGDVAHQLVSSVHRMVSLLVKTRNQC